MAILCILRLATCHCGCLEGTAIGQDAVESHDTSPSALPEEISYKNTNALMVTFSLVQSDVIYFWARFYKIKLFRFQVLVFAKLLKFVM